MLHFFNLKEITLASLTDSYGHHHHHHHHHHYYRQQQHHSRHYECSKKIPQSKLYASLTVSNSCRKQCSVKVVVRLYDNYEKKTYNAV